MNFFYLPGALVIDHRGNLFVADAGTRIQKVSPSGNVTTWVGESVGEAAGFDVDGAANVARFGVIMGMTIDDNDTIFIAEVPALSGVLHQMEWSPPWLEKMVSTAA